ncbi:MAG: energy-coupling factor transporter transmembrane protein EcfT [Oscillospiraceae bacterium]|nr:energy-coupling factor transporter transmembrane protein EcfT [Oscillospiraceae bacterium]
MKDLVFKEGIGENGMFSRSHPLLNMVWFTLVIGITMFSVHPAFLLLSFAASWCYSVTLKGVKAVKFNLLILLPVIAIMTLFNTLTVHNGVTVLFFLNGNRITLEAVLYGLASAVLLSSVIIWFSCFTVIVTAEKFVYLFGRISPAIALTLSMVMRYIPLLKNRFVEVSTAQRCMGRGVKGSGFIQRLRQYGKEISILIAWSLEASIESADSMEARGYGLKGRKSFHLYRFSGHEAAILALILILGALPAAACAAGETSIYYYPAIVLNGMKLFQLAAMLLYAALMLLPMAMDLKEARKWNL